MNQITQLLARLSTRQKISLAVVAIAVLGGLWGFARWNTERDFQPLYSGLAGEDAGAVVAKLKEGAVPYRLGENGSVILVPSARVAEMRLQMAAQGLPKTGRIGYELFDKTNFGTTDFAEQVNFRRALEGELERSVMGLSEVERARVHVTPGKDSLFLDSRQPAKASVMLKLKPGMRLSPQNVQAIAHLTASAVEGLTPENVSVLDMNGNLLSRPRKREGDGIEDSNESLEYRQKVERDLLAKINTTLEPTLGADRFRSGVSVECDFTSGDQSEESFDPNRSVMVTSQKSEDLNGVATASGVPGTASSLPRPTSRPGQAGTGMFRRTENITYQTSRFVKRMHLPQGSVKRMSISILVAQNARWEGTGAKARRVLEAIPPERIKSIEKLVAGVAGVVPDRGDQVIVETLPFDGVPGSEPPPDPAPPAGQPGTTPLPPWLPKKVTPMMLGIAGGVLLFLLLALVVMMRMRKKRRIKIQAELAAKAELEAAKGAPSPAQATKTVEEAGNEFEKQLVDQAAQREKQTLDALAALKLPPATTKKAEVLAKHLANEAKHHPENLAQVLRTWLNEQDS